MMRPAGKILLLVVVAIAVTATGLAPAAADDGLLTTPGETQTNSGGDTENRRQVGDR